MLSTIVENGTSADVAATHIVIAVNSFLVRKQKGELRKVFKCVRLVVGIVKG